MGISAVMTCYNRDITMVDRAITSVLSTATLPQFRLMLLDNHSPNDEVRKLLQSYRDPRVQVLDFGRNLGKGRGFNMVWETNQIPADDFVTVVSDDIEIVTPSWDERFMEVFKNDERIGSISAFIQEGPGMPDPEILHEQTIGGEKILVSPGSVGGDLTMYRPGLVAKAGLFTPTIYGHEDHDMAIKLAKMGYLSGYVQEIKMNHYGHDDPAWAEWKREMHDGRTGLQFSEWMKMREGNLYQKLRDVAMTRFHIPLEGRRGSRL